MKRFEARYDLRNENSHQTFMVRFPSTSEDTIGALIALISASQGRCECDECQARRTAEEEAEMEGAAASDEDSNTSDGKESPHYFLSEADRDALAEIAAKHRAKKERKKIKKAKERNQRKSQE